MKWTRLEQKGQLPLARSSHSITAVEGTCYVFGGEHEPRLCHCKHCLCTQKLLASEFCARHFDTLSFGTTSSFNCYAAGRLSTVYCVSTTLRAASGHNVHALEKHPVPGWHILLQWWGRACISLAGAQVTV